MTLVANGYTNVRIGRELGIAPETVNSILRLVYRNLGASGRAHAAALALRYGEISLADVQVPAVAPAGTLLMVDDPRRTSGGADGVAA
jgi:hypothetical protein